MLLTTSFQCIFFDEILCVLLICSVIIPLLHHFSILGQKSAQNIPRCYTVEQGKNTGDKLTEYWPKQTGKISVIINPLFDGLTYNTSGHFAHC